MRRNQTGAFAATPHKRIKKGLACTYCRKCKSRCELQDPSSSLGCRRCYSLGLVCSREVSALASQSTYATYTTASGENSASSSSTPPDTQNSLEDGSSPDAEPEPNISPPWAEYFWQNLPLETQIDRYNWWTAAPMLSICGWPSKKPQHSIIRVDNTLQDILSIGEIEFLLNMFETNYLPWMNIMPIRQNEYSVLDLVICTVTAHHLPVDHSTSSSIFPRLEALTEEVLLTHIFQPSVEAVYALAVLAFWTPVRTSSPKDGRLMSASGVNIATGMSLHEASSYAQKLRDNHNHSPAQLAETEDNARLWISLINVESMLCVGTDRESLGVRHDADKNFINVCQLDDFEVIGINSATLATSPAYDISRFSHKSSLEEARDVRLGITAKLLETLEEGLKIHLPDSPSGFDNYVLKINILLDKFDVLERIILPLCYVSSYEIAHFKVLQIHCHAYKILAIHNAMSKIRKIYWSPSNHGGWLHKTHNGRPFALHLAARAVKSGEALLMCVFDLPESCLVTAPDVIFSMIAAACMFLCLSKSVLWARSRIYLGGHSDSLLERIHCLLVKISIDTDHAAAKCALLLLSLRAGWEKQTQPTMNDPHPSNLGGRLDSDNGQSHGGAAMDFEASIQLFYGANDGFWDTFMANINSLHG